MYFINIIYNLIRETKNSFMISYEKEVTYSFYSKFLRKYAIFEITLLS